MLNVKRFRYLFKDQADKTIMKIFAFIHFPARLNVYKAKSCPKFKKFN